MKLLILLCLVCCLAAQVLKDKDVFIVNSKQLTNILNKNPNFIVLFTRADCHYCEQVWPIFLESSSMMTTGGPERKGAPCAHHNVSAGGDTTNWNLNGYPTLRLYTNGSYLDFSGEYSKRSLESFFEKRLNINVANILSESYLESYPSNNQMTVLYVHATKDDAWLSTYNNVARRFLDRKDITFHHTELDSAVLDIDTDLVMWTERGQKKHQYTGEKTFEQFHEFVHHLSYKHIHEFSASLIDMLFVEESRKMPTLFFISNQFEQYTKELVQLAKQYEDKVRVVRVEYQKDDLTARLMKFLGVTDLSFPYVVLYDHADNQKKYHQKTQDMSMIKTFMESYIRGALTPIYKSQLGNTTRGGDVVGSQVPSLLMQSKVPILFHLYAPWCTASSRFQPIFEELSRHYKDRVLFVGMDASTNESEGLYSEHVPALRLFMNEFVPYDGDLTADGVHHFLRQQLSEREDL